MQCTLRMRIIMTSMAERKSRRNTLDEKRKMRNKRKKMKRSQTKALEAHLQLERTLRSEADQKLVCTKTCVGLTGSGGGGNWSKGRNVW